MDHYTNYVAIDVAASSAFEALKIWLWGTGVRLTEAAEEELFLVLADLANRLEVEEGQSEEEKAQCTPGGTKEEERATRLQVISDLVQVTQDEVRFVVEYAKKVVNRPEAVPTRRGLLPLLLSSKAAAERRRAFLVENWEVDTDEYPIAEIDSCIAALRRQVHLVESRALQEAAESQKGSRCAACGDKVTDANRGPLWEEAAEFGGGLCLNCETAALQP